MIKVFNGDAFGIQEEEYDRNTLLQFFLKGHRNDFVLVYRGEQPVKVLSYFDILFNRDVPEQVLYMNPDVFTQARDLFLSYGKGEQRWERAVAVCSAPNEVECILYYLQNVTSENALVSDFESYSYSENLDFELLSRYSTWIFEEYEEYTNFICEALERRFPLAEKIFLDDNIDLFHGIRFHYTKAVPEVCRENTVRVASGRERFFMGIRPAPNVYISLEVMTSLFWEKHVCYGDRHPDKKFMLIRFPLHSSGLGDVITFSLDKVAMLEYRHLDYIPVIDLSIPGDGNQFSGGKAENVWEYYFEPLNEYTGEEVRQSRHVLLCDGKMDAFNPYIMEHYYNPEHIRQVSRKYLRLNPAMQAAVQRLRQRYFPREDARILGAIARGTDYRYAGFDIPIPMDDRDFIDQVRQRMTEWDCPYLFLATEDADVLDLFLQAGFGDRLLYIEQERYRYTDPQKKGVTVAKMKKAGHNYQDEIPYLSVLYLLSECTSLISNCKCGAFNVADFINGNRYEHRYCCGDAGTQWANKEEE